MTTTLSHAENNWGIEEFEVRSVPADRRRGLGSVSAVCGTGPPSPLGSAAPSPR